MLVIFLNYLLHFQKKINFQLFSGSLGFHIFILPLSVFFFLFQQLLKGSTLGIMNNFVNFHFEERLLKPGV